MNFRIFTFSTLLLSCFLAAELTAQEQPPNAGDKIITDDKKRDFSWEEMEGKKQQTLAGFRYRHQYVIV